MASKAVVNGTNPATKSDLASLWEVAITDYETRTGKSLRMNPFTSMNDAIQGTEREVEKFKGFRNDGKKADKVRTAFKNNLWLIDKVVKTIQIAGNAASAFPPAMPAALIFNAFGQVMTSFSQVSADYDKVVAFFEFMQRFLDRLSMIEGKTPPLAQFDRCIIRVFSSMLTILAVSQDYAKEHGRFKKWFNTLMEGSDPGLAGAYKEMDSAIKEMSDAVGLATLNTTLVVAQIVKSMKEGVEFVVTKTTFIDERTKVIDSKMDIVINQNQAADSKIDAVVSGNRDVANEVKELRKLFLVDRERTKEAGHDKNQDAKSRPGQSKAKTDPGENKRLALTQVASWFTDFSPGWESVSKKTKAQRREIEADSAPGTGTWLFDNSDYKKWAEHEKSVMYLQGTAGVGKSWLASRVIDKFATSSNDRNSFAYFFFREEEEGLRSLTQALYCMAYQLAETDQTYCEEVAAEYKKGAHGGSDPWRRLFLERFPSKSNYHVYLILDGIDEMRQAELEILVGDLAQLSQPDSPNVHLLLTGRPSALEEMETANRENSSVIEINKAQLATDLEKVITWNVKRLPRLKKFRKSVRNYIANKVKTNADGMRYADHMLRRLSVIGREKAVLKDLDRKMPETLEELYDLMLRECQANRTEKQYLTLKKLFAWLAYSKRSLRLDEAAELITRTVDENDKTFDIEDEIIGRSARILETVRDHDGDDDEEDETVLVEDSDQANETVSIDIQDGGSAPLGFQERSLREYFQAVDVDEHGLRTPPSRAHLTIFEMAADLLFEADHSIKDDQQPKLLSYAVEYLFQHLQEINLNKTTDQEVERVVIILYDILNNRDNVSRTFEHSAASLYSGMTSDAEATWLATIKEWAHHAISSPCTASLPTNVKVWAESIASSQELLMVLAQGHVSNMFTQYNGLRIGTAFKFARDAFNLSNIDVSEDSLESVLKVADYFPDIERDAGFMRGISVALAELELIEDSIKYANQGLEILQPGSSSLRFYLTRSVSMSQASLGNHEEAVQGVDKAIDSLPADWKDDEELVDTVKWIYEEKAGYFNTYLDRPEDAIEAFHSLNGVTPEKTQDGYTLDDITAVWTEARDPTGTKLLSLLRNWNEKERLSWLDFVLQWHYSPTIDRFDQVAAQNGDDGKAYLLECYKKYMATIPANSDRILFPQIALANTYRTVIKDQQKAKELCMTILKRNIKDINVRSRAEAYIFQIRRDLAEIIFEEFLNSSDPVQKMRLLEEMNNFPSQRTELSDLYQLEGSSISVMVALMTHVVGRPVEFQAIMEKTFDTCVDGLSDTVGWNDSSSFRLLAKILACMEGLERDALIALSCQFSKVTDEEDENVGEVEDEEMTSSDETVEEQSADKTQIDEAVISEDSSEQEAITADQSSSEEPDSVPGRASADTTIHLTETTITSKTVEDGVLKDSSTVIIEEATVEANHEIDSTDADANTEELKGLFDDEETVQPAVPDSEERSSAGLSCDGPCGRGWDSWKVPVYFCLLCTNCDLCPTCHSKRMAQNRGEAIDYWKPYCGDHHRYAKGPIKGWQGVRAGAFTIVREDGAVEEVKVQDWLMGLKTERWPAAWKLYWTKLEGVKDLGF